MRWCKLTKSSIDFIWMSLRSLLILRWCFCKKTRRCVLRSSWFFPFFNSFKCKIATIFMILHDASANTSMFCSSFRLCKQCSYAWAMVSFLAVVTTHCKSMIWFTTKAMFFHYKLYFKNFICNIHDEFLIMLMKWFVNFRRIEFLFIWNTTIAAAVSANKNFINLTSPIFGRNCMAIQCL